MLDMGPYYVTDLVNLLGPVASVSRRRDADARRARSITSEPLNGHAHPGRGRDPCHRRRCSSSSGAAVVDDDELRRRAAPARADRALRREGLADRARPQPLRRQDRIRRRAARTGARCRPGTPMPTATTACSASPTWRRRSATDRPHRASGALAFHVLEVMEAFQTLVRRGRAVAIIEPPASGRRRCRRRWRVGELD